MLSALLLSCAGHAHRTQEARAALDAMQPRAALALLNEELDVENAKEVPAEVEGDNTLLLLDRAMVLQQLDQYELSSRDLELADKAVEILDFSRNAVDDIGKYMFSDDTGPYKAPAYEKLMVNTMNMVNYLVRGDLNGARIEARRLAVMQKYLKEHEDPAVALMGPGSYLAGFIFERSGRPQEALRYYDEALQYGDYRSLHAPIQRLARKASYRSPRISRILGEAAPVAAPPTSAAQPSPTDAAPPRSENDGADESTTDADGADESTTDAAAETNEAPPAPPPDDTGELLVIVSFGRVPAKFAERVPIGLALTWASMYMSPANRATANRLALQGLVTWVNYPELGKPRGTYSRPKFQLNRQWQPLEGILAVDREAKRAWDDSKGAVVASAITRMITRVVAGEAANQAAGGGVGGLLLSLGTQATLTATDTPDTRSWSTLPARIAFGRVRLKPGKHRIVLGARGVRKTQVITMKPNGFRVINLTVLH